MFQAGFGGLSYLFSQFDMAFVHALRVLHCSRVSNLQISLGRRIPI